MSQCPLEPYNSLHSWQGRWIRIDHTSPWFIRSSSEKINCWECKKVWNDQELYLFTCLSFLCICSFNTLMERHICQTLCRFLKDEWNFLNQDDDYSSNLPISAKLWRNLPRRINEADIKVRSFTFKSPIFPCEIWLVKQQEDHINTSLRYSLCATGSTTEEWFWLWSVCSILHQAVHWRGSSKAEKERPWNGEWSHTLFLVPNHLALY